MSSTRLQAPGFSRERAAHKIDPQSDELDLCGSARSIITAGQCCQEHYRKAEELFGGEPFDRLFVVHALDPEIRSEVCPRLAEHHIYWLTIPELVKDLLAWYGSHPRKAALRHSFVGDLLHLLIGFCHLEPQEPRPLAAKERRAPTDRAQMGGGLESLLSKVVGTAPATATRDTASQQALIQRINENLEKLPEWESKIIRLRFGLDDGHCSTLEEVGKEFGISRERVRQIEARVLRKLRPLR